MKLLRNAEIRREILIDLAVTAAASAAGAFFSLSAALFALCAGGILTGVHFAFSARRYRRIAALSDTVDRILHGNEAVLFADQREGELAILQSEIEKMMLRLREQNDRLAQEKGKLKDAIADIFHQMRTPLTSMNLIASLLLAEDLSYERRLELTREIRSLLSGMNWLCETLLKISKIDAGVAEFMREPVRVKSLFERAASPLRIPIELRNQELSIECGEETYLGDPEWSVEAIGNLIKNCMEHTPHGGRISLACAENPLYTQITVSDTGSGFDPSDLPHLFDRFYKGKTAGKESFGIGLALARLIVSEQNGTILAENAPEGGARFVIRFYKAVV